MLALGFPGLSRVSLILSRWIGWIISISHMALPGLKASYCDLLDGALQEDREAVATPCPLLLMRLWKSKVESSGALLMGALPSSRLPLELC